MNSYIAATKPYGADDFETKCPACSALNRVQVVKQDGHNEPEEYYCANCGNELGKLSASLSPTVRLVDENASK